MKEVEKEFRYYAKLNGISKAHQDVLWHIARKQADRSHTQRIALEAQQNRVAWASAAQAPLEDVVAYLSQENYSLKLRIDRLEATLEQTQGDK